MAKSFRDDQGYPNNFIVGHYNDFSVEYILKVLTLSTRRFYSIQCA